MNINMYIGATYDLESLNGTSCTEVREHALSDGAMYEYHLTNTNTWFIISPIFNYFIAMHL